MKNRLIYKILVLVNKLFGDIGHCFYDFVRRASSEIIVDYFDRKLGIDTTASAYYLKENLGLYKDGTRYTPTSYLRIKKMIDCLKLNRNDTFIDFGCGKGRVIFFVATQRLKKVIGVEVDRELVDIAMKNLDNLKLNKTPIEIVHEDAATFNVKEGTVFYIFNPFGENTLRKVTNNIRESLISNPRKVRIVYFSPAYKDLLDTQDWLVPEGEIGNTEILVWHNRLA